MNFYGAADGETGEVAELLLAIEREQAAEAAYLASYLASLEEE